MVKKKQTRAESVELSFLLKARDSYAQGISEASVANASLVLRDGAFQRFEYCLELAWKTMKRILRAKGQDVQFPNDVIRDAAAAGWIEDPEIWFCFLEFRNKTSHIYNENVAKEVFEGIQPFLTHLDRLIQRLKT